MSVSDRSQGPIESQRVPLEREVVLEFEHFSSFISEYSANISLGGMFIRTDEPHLPETVFRFEVRLADDGPLIAGLGKVLWVRDAAQGSGRPTGMGVRFLKLEDDARALIEQIVREHVARGGRPFDLEQPAADSADRQPKGEGPAAEASPSRDRSSVIELPPLEDLLAKTRAPAANVSLDTPPRGWKPGIKVARPRTRPQLIAAIAAAAIVLGGLTFLVARLVGSPPVLHEAETEPVELPRAEASVGTEAAAAVPAPTFTAVEEITWRRAGNGAEIIVRLDGVPAEGSWSVDRMSDPPRHLLKLAGARRPYPTDTFEVGFGGVRQLRTGYHDTGAGNEQHVVVDLDGPRVVLDEAVVEGSTVFLRFRRLSS